MTVIDLDTLRADLMRLMLNAEGRDQIWLYDTTPIRFALAIAEDRQSYDDLVADTEGLVAGKRFALTGPGIQDSPFDTPAELCQLVAWLCCDGYLSCYAADRWRWAPHLERDQEALREWQREARLVLGGTAW